MAVTKIWQVRGWIGDVLSYVKNPQKTDMALQNVLDYAANESKTEQGLFVSGLNCDAETAAMQFPLVKKQFGKTGGIIAYHAYQSFEQGELSAEQAHEIGMEFAKEVWGKRFQVVVATHLNSNCLHNHFVVNSVSFVDGKRCRAKQWRELSQISDQVCRNHNLKTIEIPENRRVPLPIYKEEQKGKPTRLNLAKAAVDEAILVSHNLQELSLHLRKEGYICRFGANRKYWTISQRDWQRPISLARMGAAYTNEKIMDRLKSPVKYAAYSAYQKRELSYQAKKYKVKANRPKKKAGGLLGLYFHYCYLLGVFPQRQKAQKKRVKPFYRDDLLKLNSITEEARFLCRNRIETKEQLQAKKELLEMQMKELAAERELCRGTAYQKGGSEKAKSAEREQIADLTGQMRTLRKQISLCKAIINRSDEMKGKIREAGARETRKPREKKKAEREMEL